MNIETDSRVSVLGLGLMGSALAEALLNAGHKVTVWNRTPTKAKPLTTKGALSVTGHWYFGHPHRSILPKPLKSTYPEIG